MTSAPVGAIKILVVDDLDQNLDAIEAVLTQPGLKILRARSGTAALELLLVEEVALALLDIRMPNMDGFELAELMRGAERTRDIPIIFMTAASHDPIRIFRGYEAGAVDFLHKPLDPHILKSKVDVFVQLYSQKKRIEAQLGELQRALRLNETFAAVLGHDLRNPLNAIAMGAEVLLRSSTDEKLTTVATRIRSSTRRMAKMISQLLDVARIRSGGVSLEMHSGDLMQLCNTMRDELEGDTGRVAISSSGDTGATFDVDRMSQVFSNLIGNALQHSEPGSKVSVTLDGANDKLVSVQICNQGVIPAERLESLFEPFQSHGASKAGLGLGLYIASQIVRAHGGELKVRSSDQEGTVFSFDIPRVHVGATEQPRKVTL
ncbi:MAG TPA: hybrid sensor histidine kinase/response regulator [Burkholderiales bacterium]|nr:hybrid sensor histidine kinase/response regulator [Burkholderiales bacterium]